MTTKWIQDAGHGGTDPGTSSNGLIEKFLNLEAAKHVQNRLKECGLDSDISRIDDSSLSVQNRVDLISKYERCLSHHFNGGGGNGVETIRSIHSKNSDLEELIIDEFKRLSLPIRDRPIYTRALKNDPTKDHHYMHRETGKCRTTIIEYDFLDGPNHAKIADSLYRQEMYECVVRAICWLEGLIYTPINFPKSKLYRVQVGAFTQKENAKRLQGQLITQGYEAIIVEV